MNEALCCVDVDVKEKIWSSFYSIRYTDSLFGLLLERSNNGSNAMSKKLYVAFCVRSKLAEGAKPIGFGAIYTFRIVLSFFRLYSFFKYVYACMTLCLVDESNLVSGKGAQCITMCTTQCVFLVIFCDLSL